MSISFSDEVNEELITTTAILPEDSNEGSLRPRTINEYIGQEKVKENMSIFIKAAKGRCIGIVPQIIEKGGRAFQDIDIYIPCDSLSDRKDLLLAHSDVIIALPGGIGTLDEIFTVAAAHTIGYHNKKIILLNAKGFWDSLIAMLDDLQSKGVIRGLWRDYILVANSVDEAVSAYLSTDMWEN